MVHRKFIVALSIFAAPLVFGQTIPTTDDAPPPPRELEVFTNAGTVDRIAKFDTDGTTVVDSNIYQVTGSIGINTSDVWRRLTIDAGAVVNDGLRVKRGSEAYTHTSTFS